jgi:hypothetical protein
MTECICPRECDCQSPDTEPALVSNTCPEHNWSLAGLRSPGRTSMRHRDALVGSMICPHCTASLSFEAYRLMLACLAPEQLRSIRAAVSARLRKTHAAGPGRPRKEGNEMGRKQQITVTEREQRALGVTLNPYQKLYSDPQTGLAWVENGSAGIAHSLHPNVQANSATRRMREYQTFVECRGFLYNTQACVSDDFAPLLRKYCQCGGSHN